jgi:glycosyltransferase involved in cell wall biosynthesis
MLMTKTPTKILRVVFPLYNLDFSGGTRVCFQYMNALVESGHIVYCLTPSNSRNDYLSPSPRIIRIEVCVPKRNRMLFYTWAIIRLGVAVPDCDVIVAHSWQSLFPSLIGKLIRRAKLVFLVQSDDFVIQNKMIPRTCLSRWINRAALSFAYRIPASVVAVSSFLSSRIFDRFQQRVKVLPNGIDLSLFFPGDRKLPSSHDLFRVMVLGNTAPSKGLADALEAIRIARSKIKEFKLVLVSRETIKIPDYIPCEYSNPTSDESLRSCYQRANVLLFTSHSEGFGLPPLEAMACGCPVITSDCGGIREYARNMENCLIVPVGQPLRQAEALIMLWENSLMADQIIQGGLRTSQDYAMEKAGKAFCQLIQSLM